MYQTSILKDRVKIMQRVAADGKFGKDSSRPSYVERAEVWCGVTWTKGVKAMREGALDAYDTVMFRMRWNPVVSRDSYLGFEGKLYQIISYNSDRRENTIQITVMEIVQ